MIHAWCTLIGLYLSQKGIAALQAEMDKAGVQWSAHGAPNRPSKHQIGVDRPHPMYEWQGNIHMRDA